jgi:hypothetical protein
VGDDSSVLCQHHTCSHARPGVCVTVCTCNAWTCTQQQQAPRGVPQIVQSYSSRPVRMPLAWQTV